MKNKADYYIPIMEFMAEIERRKNPYNHHGEKVSIICEKMGGFLNNADPDDLALLKCGAKLHDIGKIFLDDKLINYPRRLTHMERANMQTHTQHGFNLVSTLGYHNIICDIVGYHHENWNGTGYPHMVKENDIPLFARMIRVADTYDAITSERPYRKAGKREDAIMLIKAEAGSAFDPQMVELLISILEEDKTL